VADERRRGIDRALEAVTSQGERAAHETEVLRQRVRGREERMVALREVLKEAEALRAALGEAQRTLRAGRHGMDAERKALGSLESQLEEAGNRVREAEVRRRERAELLAEAADIEEKAAWIGTSFRTAVLGMEQKLLTHAQALFEREFSRYFGSLIDDPGLVARTDPAFTPLVMIEGEWTPAEALSGGERTSLALAFRLALAHVVRSMGSLHLDTILLDEPTDGFSPEQVIRMGELLEELALPQVIIVSHESQLAAIADRVVRVQKIEGRSVLEGSRGSATGPAPGPGLRSLDEG
jgi:exonuclease SbcC